MRKWRSSAAYRIAFAGFGAFAFCIAILAIITFSLMRTSLTQQLDSMIKEEALEIAAEYRTGGPATLPKSIAERETSTSSTRMLYAVFSPDGRRLLGSLETQRPRLGIQDVKFRDQREGPDGGRAVAIDLSPDTRLLVAVDSDWMEQSEDAVILVFGIALIGTWLVGSVGAIVFGRYLEKRLGNISRSAELIISGDTRQRMPVGPRHDEFDRVAITLNLMLDRIEVLMENLRQVSSDIAHDLRTPLARLRNALELGLAQTTLEANKTAVSDAIVRVDEVLSLFAAILRIAEVESGETRRHFKHVNLGEMVEDLAESYSPAIHERGRSLSWSVKPRLSAIGDRELLAQAVINLLENAQQHTRPGTEIRLTASSNGSWVRINVSDSGDGVPASELDRVTKRFARLDRSRTTSGHGLGLSLVSAVAELHDGRLTLEDLGPGLSATIELPIAPGGREPGSG